MSQGTTEKKAQWASARETGIQLGCTGRYIELINFKMEVSNILETRANKLSEEEKVPEIKKGLGWEGI